jgi:hypothetical protein
MPEEYQALGQFSSLVEKTRLGHLQIEREAVEEARAAVREHLPPNAYQFPLDETSLPLRIYNILVEAGFTTFGELMEQVAFDEQHLLNLPGFGEKALETVKEIIETEEIPEPELEPEPEAVEVVEAEAAEEVVEAAEADAEAVAGAPEVVVEEEPAAGEEAEFVAEAEAPVVEVEPVRPEPSVAEEAEPFGEELLDLLPGDDETDEKLAKEKAKSRRRQLVFDEDLGEVVVKRRRKASRRRGEWEDFEGLDDLDTLDEVGTFDEDEDVEDS